MYKHVSKSWEDGIQLGRLHKQKQDCSLKVCGLPGINILSGFDSLFQEEEIASKH